MLPFCAFYPFQTSLQFELLDSVFSEFSATNQYRNKHYSFADMLGMKTRHPRYLKFMHSSVPYLATVFLVDDTDCDWLNIKLCNNGFVYSMKQGLELHRHKCDGWIALAKHKYHAYLPHIMSAFEPLYQDNQAFYNYKHQRFDLKFFPRDSAPPGTPHVILTFEPGYPHGDDTAPRHQL